MQVCKLYVYYNIVYWFIAIFIWHQWYNKIKTTRKGRPFCPRPKTVWLLAYIVLLWGNRRKVAEIGYVLIHWGHREQNWPKINWKLTTVKLKTLFVSKFTFGESKSVQRYIFSKLNSEKTFIFFALFLNVGKKWKK